MKTFLLTKKNKEAKKKQKLEQNILIKHFMQKAGNNSKELKFQIKDLLMQFEKLLR